MQHDGTTVNLTDLADGTLSGPEWDAWLAAHPDAAAEVAVARRVRALIAELRLAATPLPADFEARLMARVREDATLLDLIELHLAGMGGALMEILNALLSLLPQPQPAAGQVAA
jgi:anti-sigma factor RsiW